jgi:hypothetical protein
MLRIAVTEQTTQSATLQIEGVVAGPWVEELRTACESALTGDGALTLDLAGVTFLSREAVAFIRTLMDRGVAVRDCSSFVAVQLDDANARPRA